MHIHATKVIGPDHKIIEQNYEVGLDHYISWDWGGGVLAFQKKNHAMSGIVPKKLQDAKHYKMLNTITTYWLSSLKHFFKRIYPCKITTVITETLIV